MSSFQNYSNWVNRTEHSRDQLDANRVRSLAATLDSNQSCDNSSPLPPLWHWIFFNPQHNTADLGPDGHARKGGFLPPIDLPRRMWAGGRFKFVQPLLIGDQLTRLSTIRKVQLKEGRSGALAFVTVEHKIQGSAGGDWIEEHDIVYRPAAESPWQKARVPEIDSEPADWSQEIRPDPVLLFRYSALTFNGHRIHYDREYCQQQEGYPGLIVHGPLTATLLLELLKRNLPEATVKSFTFRALRPLFDHLPYSIHGRVENNVVRLWAKDSQQQRAMEAEASL
ncbi:MaoC family dehydratase N-terminal domain-containing protein [Motiliproteus sp. MSK22-1]|uniref:FAS1-like dehydratase domain-containing protein n=1 Tax=Motiliproteus sp. MSK22-1 TaxID=1897630 RepID=UPI00097609D8|nr:MaoC family dehydratase N-terminal domain-containing protein [Motiliproteus sp. MSK22-1]OMH38887.1 acyl-CoA dehydrogenase [Motiliproteus sp. MSK22-1]